MLDFFEYKNHKYPYKTVYFALKRQQNKYLRRFTMKKLITALMTLTLTASLFALDGR